MSSVQGTLAAEERRRWLAARLHDAGEVSLTDGVDQFGVSAMTVRRDLNELEERGVARRVRGGARAVGPQTFDERRDLRPRAKGRIAAKALELVPSIGVVSLDASSTVMRLGALLDGARDLTVLTNGPETFTVLQARPGLHPLLTGGQLDQRTGSLVGPLACRSAGQLAADVLIASAAALDDRIGATETTLEEAEVKRSLAAVAARVVLLVDSSKLGRRAVATALGWDRVDVVVTELDPTDRRLDPFRGRVDLR